MNESQDDKSQIEEFLREYKGEGIQHIALGSDDIYQTVDILRSRGIPFQDTPDTYYELVDERVKDHGEPTAELEKRRILVDGAPTEGQGLLLQIFTQNVIGPIFFEIIQRKGNEGFGEGNFKALFEIDRARPDPPRSDRRGMSETDADALAERVAFAMLANEGTGKAWGIQIEEAREGYSRIRMKLTADMLNGHGKAHGGMVYALADTAFAYACNSRNVRTVGAQATMVFLDGAEEGEVLVAEAQEQALVVRSGVYNVSVRTDAGRPIAEFQGFSRSVGGPYIEAGDE